ncbi:MAG: hypothetical protein NTU79_17585 [Planctomycetota bacterium]|nr:hypothetical protein [Planctomycetota bacterium]
MSWNSVSFFSNFNWFLKEIFKVVRSPIGVLGGLLDAARGWKFSRSWRSLLLNLPAVVFVAGVYIVYVFSRFHTADGEVQRFLVESEKICSTSTLEKACDQLIEPDFCREIGLAPPEADPKSAIVTTELTKKQVELLCKRILSIEADNQTAHYRLGLIYFINGNPQAATDEMRLLAEGKNYDFPQANAWLAKSSISSGTYLEEKSLPQWTANLAKAVAWKNGDVRLMRIYSRRLEQVGETQKAIVVAQKAAFIKPELNLDLARLYARVGNQQGLRECAYAVEECFGRKLNTSQEQDTDRLAIAEVWKLMGKLDLASTVLTQGLLDKPDRPLLNRELSEIQLIGYVESIAQQPDGKFRADLALLEKAAETAPDNPSISVEIAKLLPMGIQSTKKLVDVLKKQIHQDIVGAQAYMFLAEGYYGSGNIKEAIRNWELALQKDSRNTTAMNNLAVALARSNPANLDRPFELLSLALSLAPSSPELLDSLGDVLMIANRPKEAINKYELTIRQDKSRLSTRKKMVDAYKAIGMEDEAVAQSKVIQSMIEAAEIEKSKDGLEKDEANTPPQ